MLTILSHHLGGCPQLLQGEAEPSSSPWLKRVRALGKLLAPHTAGSACLFCGSDWKFTQWKPSQREGEGRGERRD